MARVTRKRSAFSLHSLNSSLSEKERDENPFKKGGKLVRYEQPRQKKVLQQLASADEVTGLNLDEHFRLNVPIHFTVRCGELEKGNLKVVCKPAKGAQIKVKPLGSHSYACTITPLQLGSHKIFIHYGHNHISGSPFRVTFNPPGNASACKVVETYPECQQCTEEDEMVFCVSTKDAGEGVLSASVTTTATKQYLPVEITAGKDLDSDHLNVRFTPTEDTHYVLSVKYDNQHIQGSPFLIVISDASKCRTEGKGLKSATAENQNSFLVLTEKAGPGMLDVEIEGDGCTVDSSISSTTENEHLYKVTYVPTMPGTYKISVTWGGEGIPGSPFEVTCLAGPDTSKCIVTGPNVPVEINKPVELRVDASNARNGQLAAKAVGDTSGSTHVKIDEVEPNVFNISLNPTTLEGYTLTVAWGDMPISGSPFHLNLFPSKSGEVEIAEFPSTLLQVGHPIKVTFDTSKAGRGKVTASCKGKKVIEVPVSVTQIPNTPKYDCEFTPPLKDIYYLSIKWGGKHIKGSPFLISLLPIDVSKVQTNGPRQIFGRMGPVDFNMYTDDAGVGKITATCLGTNTGKIPVEIKKTATDNRLSFQPPQADMYTFDVCYGGQQIPGSPYHVNTHPPDASKIKVIKPEKIQVGRIVTTTCDCTLAGAGEICASCIGEKYGAIELDVTKYRIAHFDITFNPILPDIFTISVTWGGQQVPGFPLRYNLLPPEPEKVIVGDLHTPDRAGTKELVWLDLDCSHTGPGAVKAECRGESAGDVPVKVKSLESDRHLVTFNPKQADLYKLLVYYADKHLPNSPFLINLIPPQPDKVKHTATSLPDEKGAPAVLSFDTSQAGRGSLTAKAVGESAGPVSVEVKETAPNYFNVLLQSPTPDVYTIDVYWEKKPVKGSPFIINILPPDPEKVIVGELHIPDKAGTKDPVWMDLDCSHTAPRAVKAECRGESAGDVPVKVKSLESDRYQVTFKPKKADLYKLSVYYDDKSLPNSPFLINLIPPQPDKVEHTATSLPDEKGAPAVLSFDTSQAGRGGLTAKAVGESAGPVSVEVKETAPNYFDVLLQSPTPDIYTVDVYWEEKPVKGSPFIINLLPPDASKAKVTEPKAVACSTILFYKCDASDAGAGDITATCEGKESGNIVVAVLKHPSSQYEVAFTLDEPDIYTLSIKWAGEEVPKSPFITNLLPPDPEKVVVGELHIPDKAGTKDPVWMDLDCSHTGPGAVKAECRGESAGDVPVKVKSLESDRYQVTFKPKKADLYKLSVYYADKHLPNSPFLINLIPPQPEKVEHAATSLPDERGAPAVLSFDTSQAGRGGLTAKAVGKSAGPVLVQVKETAPNYFNVLLQSPTPDVYTVNVYWEKKPVKGSPFIINLLPPDPEKLIVGELRIPDKAGTKDPVWMDLDCSHTGPGAVKAECRGESAGDVPVKVKSLESDRYQVTFKPKKADLYKLSVYYADKHLPNSPFLINLIPPQPDKVEHTATSLPDEKGAPAVLSFDTSQAGRGSLTAKAVGESAGQVPVQVKETAPNYFDVLLQSPTPDIYTVDVYWEEKPVKGSPFIINLLPPDPEKLIVGELRIPDKAGTKDPVWMDLDCSHTGPGAVKAECRGESAGDVPVKIKSLESDRYQVTFKPKKADLYKLSVYYADKHLPNSPFLINLIPPQPDKVEHTATSLPDEKGAPAVLSFDTSQAGRGSLTAKAVGESAGQVPVQVKETAPNYFDVLLQSPTPDIYTVDVYWEEKPVKGSPFIINLLPPDPEKLIVGQLRIPDKAGTKDPVWMDLDCSHTGPGAVKAECRGESAGDVPVKVKSLESDRYQVTFKPKKADLYKLSVYYADKHLPNSPFLINLIPPQPDKVEHTATSLPDEKGAPAVLSFDTSQAGRGSLTAKAVGESAGPVSVEVKETAPNYFNVLLQSPTPDVYTVDVYWEKKPVKGSPFIINLFPPDASKVKVTEPKAVACSTILIYKCDASDAGADDITATCEGKESGSIEVAILKHPSSQYEVSFALDEPDIYTLSIKWAGEEVPKSPFIINLLPPDPEKVVVGELHIPDKAGTNDPVWMDLDCSHTGPGEVRVDCKGETVGRVQVNVKPCDNDIYRIKLLPKVGDMYTLSLHYGSGEVPGSPFAVDLLPSYPENVKLTATESPKQTGDPFSLTFDTSKAGKGSLNAISMSNSSRPVPLEVKHKGSHAYKVLVSPPCPDVYKVAVYWVDVPVKDSPFTIDARHPEYVHCSEPSFTKVGEPVSMTVDTSKAGPGIITAKCSGKLCGTVPIKITATTSSLYTLSPSCQRGKICIPSLSFMMALR